MELNNFHHATDLDYIQKKKILLKKTQERSKLQKQAILSLLLIHNLEIFRSFLKAIHLNL